MQSVVDDLRKKKKRGRRETSSDSGEREREREQERGRDWREREKESVVSCVLEERFRAEVESQAHSLENLTSAGNKLDFKKRVRLSASTDMDNMRRQRREAILVNKRHICCCTHPRHWHAHSQQTCL